MSDQSKICHGTGSNLSLLETLRYEPDKGFIRKSAHLERMARSACLLKFDVDLEALSDALDIEPEQTSRVRLELFKDGTFETKIVPFKKQTDDTQWTIAIAKTQIDSANRLLGHKTSKRDVYLAARSEFAPEDINEVILRNEKGEVCEGTITNIFMASGDGKLLTPHLSCGLLPGIYRQHLLATDQVQEAVLTINDFQQAPEIFVGNSLRELIRARLAPDALVTANG